MIKSPIKIPIIQRDYAQGRPTPVAKEVREQFLKDLFQALSAKKKLHLDFIYGIYEEKGEDRFFIPIDGQQRLTLLYLLHWYFSKKEKVSSPYFPSLTYETRIGAREFCKLLPSLDEIDFSRDSITSQIKNHKSFIPYWEYDPTVSSMLVVLDDIHKKAKEYPNVTFKDLEKITYEVFDLKDFGEVKAEELYRKINSRGKLLTPLENFKAMIVKLAKKSMEERVKNI